MFSFLSTERMETQSQYPIDAMKEIEHWWFAERFVATI